MDNLAVKILPSSEEGALYPRHDSESDYVTLDSRISQEWPFGINIDNLIILDFNSKRILSSVEVLKPRRLWKKASVESIDAKRQSGCLALADDNPKKSRFFMPEEINVVLDIDRTIAQLVFGALVPPLVAVRLSPKCEAIVSSGNLVGFVFRISNRQ